MALSVITPAPAVGVAEIIECSGRCPRPCCADLAINALFVGLHAFCVPPTRNLDITPIWKPGVSWLDCQSSSSRKKRQSAAIMAKCQIVLLATLVEIADAYPRLAMQASMARRKNQCLVQKPLHLNVAAEGMAERPAMCNA